MIKEKIIFETITGKIYDSLKTALEAEKSEQTDSSKLINKFCELKHETAELHRKYDPVLNSMAEALNSMGVNVSTLNSTDDERSGSPISKSHPKVRIAKVHASSFRKI